MLRSVSIDVFWRPLAKGSRTSAQAACSRPKSSGSRSRQSSDRLLGSRRGATRSRAKRANTTLRPSPRSPVALMRPIYSAAIECVAELARRGASTRSSSQESGSDVSPPGNS